MHIKTKTETKGIAEKLGISSEDVDPETLENYDKIRQDFMYEQKKKKFQIHDHIQSFCKDAYTNGKLRIVINCSFCDHMDGKEIRSLRKQINNTYNILKGNSGEVYTGGDLLTLMKRNNKNKNNNNNNNLNKDEFKLKTGSPFQLHFTSAGPEAKIHKVTYTYIYKYSSNDFLEMPTYNVYLYLLT